ncbi:hypothetical protein [Ectopseudomonas toyotomiensis]|uniref:Uncharacterized protein n=1 Tax=Ectopseudomonas toyotomiensis TaxID=554344 RepID=A0AA42IMW3_9GAMM|nr:MULTISPECIES: hypothetical protein [Pseudomonas]MDH0702238.1 hypothetical protein [Pseudomonas toyotomiensis]
MQLLETAQGRAVEVNVVGGVDHPGRHADRQIRVAVEIVVLDGEARRFCVVAFGDAQFQTGAVGLLQEIAFALLLYLGMQPMFRFEMG